MWKIATYKEGVKMSRSINGNLLGKAARDEMSDLRERIQHDAEAKHLTKSQMMDVCQELADIMDPGEYERWYTLTPAAHFSDDAATKLIALKSLAFEVEQEIASDTEWLGELHNTRDVATVIANQLGSVRMVESNNPYKDLEIWQQEVEETRKSDYPR